MPDLSLLEPLAKASREGADSVYDGVLHDGAGKPRVVAGTDAGLTLHAQAHVCLLYTSPSPRD